MPFLGECLDDPTPPVCGPITGWEYRPSLDLPPEEWGCFTHADCAEGEYCGYHDNPYGPGAGFFCTPTSDLIWVCVEEAQFVGRPLFSDGDGPSLQAEIDFGPDEFGRARSYLTRVDWRTCRATWHAPCAWIPMEDVAGALLRVWEVEEGGANKALVGAYQIGTLDEMLAGMINQGCVEPTPLDPAPAGPAVKLWVQLLLGHKLP